MKKRTFRSFVFLAISLSLCCIAPVRAQATSPSGYTLIGTIRSRDFVGAVITVSNNEQLFYRLGETLPDGSKVVKVQSDSVLLKGSDGIVYQMYIVQGNKNISAVLPYSSSDPFAGKVMTPAAERPPNAYEKRHQKRLGTRSSDDE